MNHTNYQFRDKHTVGGIVFYKHAFLVLIVLLARLHEVQRAIALTPVVHVPVRVRVPVRVTLALKFSISPYLDNHSSESIHIWTIDILLG